MNKGDLVEAVASELKLNRPEAQKAVETVLQCISKGMRRDEKVAIAGFGTFAKKLRPARQGMNPATKQPIQIAASTTCTFKPATQLKDELAG